jgi:hypothetical protein
LYWLEADGQRGKPEKGIKSDSQACASGKRGQRKQRHSQGIRFDSVGWLGPMQPVSAVKKMWTLGAMEAFRYRR